MKRRVLFRNVFKAKYSAMIADVIPLVLQPSPSAKEVFESYAFRAVNSAVNDLSRELKNLPVDSRTPVVTRAIVMMIATLLIDAVEMVPEIKTTEMKR